jgi:hypothetical protein
MRKTASFLVLAVLCLFLVGAKKAAPVSAAPDILPHQIALFLASMSKDGARSVTFRATARGTHFFLEEPNGVTVFVWEGGEYRKSEFLRASTLPKAVKRYKASFAGTK